MARPPDAIIALSDARRVVALVDATTGEELKRHEASCQESVAFSADGRWLICSGHEGTSVFGVDGRVQRLSASHVAMSPDGARVAIAWDGAASVRHSGS